MPDKSNVENIQINEATVLNLVFNYLKIKDLKNVSLTCKTWENLSRPKRFSILKLSKLGTSIKLSNIFIKKEEIKDEALRFKYICNKYGHLVRVFATDYSLDKKIAIGLMESLKNITHFTLYDCFEINTGSLIAYLQPLKKLQKLNLCHIEVINKGFQTFTNFPNTLKVLYLERISDKPLTIFGLPQNYINTELNFISSASLNFLNNHNSIEELFFYDSHNSLLKPFAKSYPTLKKIVIGNYFKAKFTQDILQIIQNNPQLSSIDIYGCKDAKVFIKAVLKYIRNLNSLVIFSLKYFLNFYESYLGFYYKYSNDKNLLALDYDKSDLLLFMTQLIQRMPYLTLISIKLNFQYYELIQVIANEVENLTDLILYSPNTTNLSVNNEIFMRRFFKNMFYGKSFKCSKSLIKIEFIGFNILNFKLEYLSQFKKLEFIRFIKLLNLESMEEIQSIISKYIEISDWKVIHDYSTSIGITEFYRR